MKRHGKHTDAKYISGTQHISTFLYFTHKQINNDYSLLKL